MCKYRTRETTFFDTYQHRFNHSSSCFRLFYQLTCVNIYLERSSHLYELLLFNVYVLFGTGENFYDFLEGVVSWNTCDWLTWPSNIVDNNCVINREFGYLLHSGEQSGFEVVSQFTFTHFASLTPLFCVNIDLERLPSFIRINIGLITSHHVSGYSLN